MLLCLLSLGSAARAAEVTDMPPALRGDVSVGWEGAYEVLSLVDQGYDVGRSVEERHALVLGATFSATDWAALRVELPVGLTHRLSWPQARSLIYDPTIEAGSMAAGDLLDDGEPIQGNGAEGLGVAIVLQPFAEARGNTSTWRVELGWRRADPTWLLTGGSGWGAPQWWLRSAFSARRGPAEPYAAIDLLGQGTAEVDLADASGQVVTPAAEVHPPNELGVRAGAEFVALSNPTTGARFALDLHATATYVAWAAEPAGLRLGSTLPETEGILVTRTDHARLGAGLGIRWRIFRYLGIHLGVEGAWVTPHRLESPYAIDSGLDSFVLGGQGSLVFSFRPPPASASSSATSPL